MKNRSTMAKHVDEYLAVRRSLGFELTVSGTQLRSFATFADKTAPGRSLTLEIALTWAQKSDGAYPARRLETLRPFARYLSILDAHTEIPPKGILGPARRRLQPYIYSDAEIGAVLDAAEHVSPAGGLRAKALRTYFGLLVATGMRPREPLRLIRKDVDLDTGTVRIRNTKFSKSRLVVLHGTVNQRLRAYAQERDQAQNRPKSEAFFLLDDGTPLTYRKAAYAFLRIREKQKWRATGGRPAPRLYDFRHTFVCRRLLSWYSEGVDVHASISALSTYLGHVKVTDTYWYVTGIPELLEIAASRFERFIETGKRER